MASLLFYDLGKVSVYSFCQTMAAVFVEEKWFTVISFYAILHVEETGRAVLDGLREIYVNTKYNDGSEIAELMQCLLEPVVTNPKFPALAQELQAEKGNVKGDESMCKLVEEYAQKRAKEYGEQQKAEGLIEGRKEGIKEGKTAGTLETLVSLVKEKSLDPVAAARKANMSESEFMKLVQG